MNRRRVPGGLGRVRYENRQGKAGRRGGRPPICTAGDSTCSFPAKLPQSPPDGKPEGGAIGMAGVVRVALVTAVVGVAPVVYFRYVYDTDKRLRIVHPGRVYRSGQMTADGFADAVNRYHMRTIINVQ